LFYGWYIVAAGAILCAFTGGITFYALTALVNPIVETFGWSYAVISLAMTLRGVEMGLLNPVAGFLVDRWPARKMIFSGMLCTGLGLVLLSQTANLGMYFGAFFLIALGGSLAVYIAPMTVVARWFHYNLGKASSLVMLGIGVGGLLVPVVTAIIEAVGWRNCILIMAGVILVTGLPLAFVFRDRPSDYGLLPDGRPQSKKEAASGPRPEDIGLTLTEAMRTRTFWQIGLALSLQVMGFSAVVLHVMPFLEDLSVKRETASLMAMLIPLASVPARLAYGWFADRFRPAYVSAVSMILTGIAMLLFANFSGGSLPLLFAAVILFGIGIGGFTPLIPVILRGYYGLRRFGTIYGMSSAFSTVGTVVAPWLAGRAFDVQGSYHQIWLIFGICSFGGAVLMLSLRRKTHVNEATDFEVPTRKD
jgi:MFS family permease